jgi:hypothetical protein
MAKTTAAQEAPENIGEVEAASAPGAGAPGAPAPDAIEKSVDAARAANAASLVAARSKHGVSVGDEVTVKSNYGDLRNPFANNGQGHWFRAGTPETVVADEWLVHQLDHRILALA